MNPMNHQGAQGMPIEILLVEDNPGDVRLTQEALKEGKVTNNLHVVMDGEQAMDFLNQRGEYVGVPRPDLILLDLNLPRKDGREILAEIKKDDKLKKIPVVVLTTSRDYDDINQAYDLNCNCYISKPVELEEFIEVIESIDNFWLTIVKLPNDLPSSPA